MNNQLAGTQVDLRRTLPATPGDAGRRDGAHQFTNRRAVHARRTISLSSASSVSGVGPCSIRRPTTRRVILSSLIKRLAGRVRLPESWAGSIRGLLVRSSGHERQRIERGAYDVLVSEDAISQSAHGCREDLDGVWAGRGAWRPD
jgi:hypothetical protein